VYARILERKELSGMNAADDKEKRAKSKLFPGVAWSEAIQCVEKIFNLGKHVSYMALAKEYGLTSPNTGTFKARISAAKQFGLIDTARETITLTDDARILLVNNNEQERHRLHVKCFSSPVLYRKLIDRYENGAIPSQSTLENILMHDFDITVKAKETAAMCFLATVSELNFDKAGILILQRGELNEHIEDENADVPTEQSSPIEKIDDAVPSTDKIQHHTVDTHELKIPTFTPGKEIIVKIPSDLSTDDVEIAKMHLDILGKYLDKYVEKKEKEVQ